MNNAGHPRASGSRQFRLSRTKLLTSGSSLYSRDDEDDDDDSYILSDEPSLNSFFQEFGLMITIDNGRCRFELCNDAHYSEIHPNCYAPGACEEMKLLGGGGSGVCVFSGNHPKLGNLVMKHGGFKDMTELFALATIQHELKGRGATNNCENSALDMQRRLPEFKMIYISPNHIIERSISAWDQLKYLVDSFHTRTRSPSGGRRTSIHINSSHLKCLHNEVNVRLFEGNDENVFAIQLDTESKERNLSIIFPQNSCERLDIKTILLRTNSSYEDLETTVEELLPIMEDRLLKFTLAQKTIGGDSPKTGNQWLYEGKLHGPVLDNLISQFIRVIRLLQELTHDEERDVVKIVRDELTKYEGNLASRVKDISEMVNSFVGNAIKKNFCEEKGRVGFLKDMGQNFRDESLILTSEEVLPANFIGKLLRPTAVISDVFCEAPNETSSLQLGNQFWKSILHCAVDNRKSMSHHALQRIWNCGLSDAGIHNLFVSETNLYLFDLGEPELQSLPGFLTKFLFSFLHTLGMEEDNETGWVRRFVLDGDKLNLTESTNKLLPKAYEAFETCLDELIDKVLDGDNKLRWLLLQYVTLQLLSDTAFCLQRWTVKGGGRDRSRNHQKGIEKWLWRALWDIYIVFDINTRESWARFRVELPNVSG